MRFTNIRKNCILYFVIRGDIAFEEEKIERRRKKFSAFWPILVCFSTIILHIPMQVWSFWAR